MSVDYRPEYDPADVDSDYGNTGGDITVPTFTANLKPFRFWCQKALPLVYDDSLSYYEVLCKVVKQMNDFLTDLQTATGAIDEFAQQFVINQQFLNDMADQLGQNVDDLESYINDRMDDFMTAYTQLQTYVNNYFDNLDVQQEINNKLDEMASDGTFNTLFDPVITTWMTTKTAQIDAAIAAQDAVQAQQNGRISVLEGRMDTFDGLPAGSTAGNAELIGIRTNFLGEVYPTAGDAVRSSDMIASGFDSIPFTRLEEWNGNESASVYDTIQFDVSAYKGGRVIMIANMEGFESAVVGIGVAVYATNVSGKTVDADAHAYILGSSVFVNYSVIPTDISGEERIALYFNIPDNFSYQYLKMGFVERIPISEHTEPEAIVYATSWSKTPVDDTLSIAGAAADAKATGDALDELNERLDNVTEESPINFFARDIFNRFVTGSDHSVTYTKGDGIVTANGTATGGDANKSFINRTDALPSWMIPGETLHISVKTSDTHLRFCVSFYDSNNNIIGTTQYITGNKDVLIPSNTASVVMYLNVQSGNTVTNATIRIMAFRSPFVLKSLEELKQYKEYTDYGITRLSQPQTADGHIYINPSDWEIGGFSYSDHAITYGSNNKRIRTKQGFGYTVNAGDIIGLSDYTYLGFYVVLKYAKDGVMYGGGYKTADYIVPNDGELYLQIYKQSDETVIDNIYEYLSKFFIRRINSVISDASKNHSNGTQYVVDHQNGTPIVVNDPTINNVIVCGKNIFRTPHGMTTYNSNGVLKTFKETNGTITVTSEGATGAVVAPNVYTTVNGETWNCLYKFKLPVSANVVISPNASKELYLYGNIYMQISDGVKTISAYNEPVIFKAAANTEYGIRIYTATGYADTVTFRPQIELDASYPTEFEPFMGLVIDENGNTISINTPSETLDGGVILNSYKATVISYNNANISFTHTAPTKYDQGYAIYTVNNKKPDYKQPMLTFIDDDTTNTTYVQNYHDVMESLGVVGNYAAMTKQISENDALKTMLLNYEAEGFGVLLHCYYQSGATTDYFRPEPSDRDIDLVRENMMTGLRAINGFGFISKDYWVTPYGVNDPEIKGLAKSLGLKAVISTLNDTPNVFGVTDRYSIGRYSFAANETSINQNIPCIKRGMDACLANGGWIIVTTHANTWGDAVDDVTAALSEIVTYANTIGMKVVNFQEGFETYF